MATKFSKGFPVSLDLTGRACLLVGAGRIALRKAQQLLASGASVTVVAPSIDPGFDELPVRQVQREFEIADLDDVWLVITATGNPILDQQIFDAAESRRLWCNSADDPQRCSFILPAVHRQGALTIAISTGGASPAVASWLRSEIASYVGPEFVDLVGRISFDRALIKHEGRSTEDIDWRPIIEATCEELGIRSLRAVTV